MQPLLDPLKNRVIKSIQPPPHKPLPSELLFKNNNIQWSLLRDFLKKQGRVKAQDFKLIIKKATHMFTSQSNLIVIDDPITIVGDIHGQFYDFLKIIETDVGGDPQKTKYLFLGDYVDRGSFSVECLLLILAMKISRPKEIIMLRGNHQCRQLTSFFNFRQQCLSKYNQQIYDQIMQMFDCLPLACLVNGKFLCVHGGISHEIRSLQDIKKLDRFKQVPKNGIFCDLVWADPIDNQTGACQKFIKPNDARGCSYYFGYELTKSFLDKNKLISLIRAHEAQAQGFKMYKWGGKQKFPTVITVFSAPNYCDFYNNKGAVIKFQNNTLNIQQFIESPHPYLLPNFLNLFSWSLPFVSQKVTQMFYYMIRPHQSFNGDNDLPLQLLNKQKIIELLLKDQKAKIQENTSLVDMNGSCPDNKLIETGKFKAGKKQSFEEKKDIDLQNEKRPTF